MASLSALGLRQLFYLGEVTRYFYISIFLNLPLPQVVWRTDPWHCRVLHMSRGRKTSTILSWIGFLRSPAIILCLFIVLIHFLSQVQRPCFLGWRRVTAVHPMWYVMNKEAGSYVYVYNKFCLLNQSLTILQCFSCCFWNIHYLNPRLWLKTQKISCFTTH